MNVTKIRAAARAAMLMSASAMGLAADVTVTSMTARQREPWDGKVPGFRSVKVRLMPF